MGEDALDLWLQARQDRQVQDANGAPADLVLIGRPDAALSGADLTIACAPPRECVELAMQRQDQGRILGDAQIIAADLDPLRLDRGDLGGQGPGVDDDAVADDRKLALRTTPEGRSESL